MLFEWDEDKDQANIQKHGVGFETAKLIFDDSVLTWQDNRRNYGEDRYISIGRVRTVLIVVVHTNRAGRIRLISARPASRKERQAYHEKIR